MKYLFVILLFISIGAFAQNRDEKTLERSVEELDKALISKDTVVLKRLFSDDLSYGHSNGWIENKQEIIEDLYNGKLTYKQISKQSQKVNVSGDAGAVRLVADFDVEMNGKPIQLKLSVLQVWIWKNKHWVLFARQSTKI